MRTNSYPMFKTTVAISISVFMLFLAHSCRDSNQVSAQQSRISPRDDRQAPAVARADGGYRRISASEAKRIMDENTEVVILDVRNYSEFTQQRIKKAFLLPLNYIERDAESLLPDKSAIILVYCRRGNRSRTAANTLISMGYTNVYDFGGIEAWPYGTVRD